MIEETKLKKRNQTEATVIQRRAKRRNEARTRSSVRRKKRKNQPLVIQGVKAEEGKREKTNQSSQGRAGVLNPRLSQLNRPRKRRTEVERRTAIITEEEASTKGITGSNTIHLNQVTDGWTPVTWSCRETLIVVSDADTDDVAGHCRPCNDVERRWSYACERIRGGRGRFSVSRNYKGKLETPAQAKPASLSRLQSDRGRFLAALARPTWVSHRVSRSQQLRRGFASSCSLRPRNRSSAPWHMAQSEELRSRYTGGKEEGRYLFPRIKEAGAFMLPARGPMPCRRRGGLAFAEVPLASPWGFRCGMAHKCWSKVGCCRQGTRAGGNWERTSYSARLWKGRWRWTYFGYRTTLGGPSKNRASSYMVRQCGATVFKAQARTPPGARGWCWWSHPGIALTSGDCAGREERGCRDSGVRSLHIEEGADQEEVEARSRERSSGSRPPEEQRQDDGKGQEEQIPLSHAEEEKATQEPQLSVRERLSLLGRRLFKRRKLDRPPEEKIETLPRVSLQDAGGDSNREVSIGWSRGGRAGDIRSQATTSQDTDLFPDHPQAIARCEEPRLPGDVDASPLHRSSTGWTISHLGRRLISSLRGHRYGHKAGVADCKAPRGIWGRRGVKRPRSCAIERAETCPPHREGRGKRFLGPRSDLVRGELATREPPQRKRKGRKGKNQERKRQRKGPQRELGLLGRRWKRQTGRETEKRRGRDIVPLFGNEIPGTLADEPCVTPTAKSSQKPPGKIGDSPLGTLISEEGGSGGNSFFLRSLATGRCNKEGVHGITEPLNKAEWLEALSTTVSLVDLGIKLAWGYQAGYLALSSNRARPTRTAGLSRGGLFPLPVSFPETLKWGCAGFEPCALMEQAVSCWAALGCAALNAHYGLPEEGKRRRPGKVHISALENMRGVIKRFLLGEEKIDFSFADVVSDLKGKKVSYSGEEIQQPSL